MTRKQILLLSAAIALAIPLLLLAALEVEKIRLSRYMQVQLQGRSAELDRQLNRLSVLPRVLARHPHVKGVLLEQNGSSLQNANLTLRHSQLDSQSSFAFVMDTEGDTVAASNFEDEISFVGVNYGFRPYFTEAMSDGESTFFAIGATTGIPGFFAANAVKENVNNNGVVVVKADLAGLLDSWKLSPYEWLAVDELGVVILSTREEFLYAPTGELENADLAKITSDRRYVISESAVFEITAPHRGRFSSSDSSDNYFIQQHSLSAQNWKLILGINQSGVWLRALMYVAGLGAFFTVIGLGLLNILTQKRLVATEHRHAMELELEVEQRTDELRSTQEALITESNYAMLGRMSGAINHEINQPLASLRLNLASIRKVIEKPDANIDEIRQIVVDSDRTTKRIGRVVATLRSLAGRYKTNYTQVNVRKLIDDIIETVHRERPALSKTLQHCSVPQDLHVRGNEILLQQALLNLLYNGFDAAMNTGHPAVMLDVQELDKNVMFRVIDSGEGVSEAVEPVLFEPFATDKKRASGLGLGLTLAKMIADEHNGDLYYNRAKDEHPYLSGSEFTLVIPSSVEA